MTQAFRNPKDFSEATLRYFKHVRTGKHTVALYYPAGMDIAGPAAVRSLDSIDEARSTWAQLRDQIIARGWSEPQAVKA